MPTQRADYGHWRAETEDRFPVQQLRVLPRVAAGLSDKEIARDMGIGVRTAKAHVERLRFRLGMSRNRVEAVGEAIRRGILKPLLQLILAIGAAFGMNPIATDIAATTAKTFFKRKSARRQA